MLCRNERKVESFPDLGVSCEERGGDVGVVGVVWRVFGTNRGMIVGLVEVALKGADIYS